MNVKCILVEKAQKRVAVKEVAISEPDFDNLMAILGADDRYSNLSKLCAIARYLRDDMGINIGE